jgi:hypothetical protein
MNSETSLKPAIVVICFLLLTLSPAISQDTLNLPPASEINKARLFTTIGVETAVWTGTFSYLHFIWYKPYNRVPFHFKNDNKAYLQMDKFGHAYASYIESYIGYKMLRNAGVRKGPALLYGGTLGIILQTPIEVFDGLYDWWGCSWGDQIANTAGSLLVIGQELLFDDQPLKYKWSLRKSPYEYSASGKKEVGFVERLVFDYNAHTYWLSMPLKTIAPNSKIPAWLCLSAGYGANGMFGKFENITSYEGVPVPPTDRYRQYLLSMDIDWTKIKTDSKFLKAILNCMVFIKLPFPTLEFNSLGKIHGYWLYY